MKTVEYLSPTSLKTFHEDKTEFYLRYLSDNKPDKIPQTQPMSIGSAFDAYVKNYLVKSLYGESCVKTTHAKYDLQTLFEAQVEPHNREWAWENGRLLFEVYQKLGALADLMIELQGAKHDPRFEVEIKGEITYEKFMAIIFGKPDLYFINGDDAHIVYDWKVNGYCSSSKTSPKKRYVKIRPGGDAHKQANVMRWRGLDVDIGDYLEGTNEDWAVQLSTYAWLLGEPVGSEFIVGVEQLVGPKGSTRVASFRSRVSKEFQCLTLARYHDLWNLIKSGHFFREMTLEDSKARCAQLDQFNLGLQVKDPKDQWFKDNMR